MTKYVVGFLTGSMAMISSAIDSTGDLFVSVVNLVVVRVSGKGPDDDHNYGHEKIEGVAAMFEGGFILASGAFIVYESLRRASSGYHASEDSVLGILTMVPIVAMTTATALYLRKVAKRTGSLVVRADAVHYSMDVYVNVAVLVAVVLVRLTGKPIFDVTISIAIALYMLRSSFHVVRDGFDVVMDKSLDPETVAKVSSVLAACTEIESFHDLKTLGGKVPRVDFHVVVARDRTAVELHDLFLDLRARIRLVTSPPTKVLVHAAAPASPDASPDRATRDAPLETHGTARAD